MNRLRIFFKSEVPLWVAIITLIMAVSLAWMFFVLFYGQTVRGYDIGNLSDGSQDSALIYGPQKSLSNVNFFNTVKQNFVDQKADFIEADLSGMLLRVYKQGAVVKEVKILAKGKEGSWWETPAGLYQIESKEPSHFSSFGKVYQPWSMEFQGNFFIHGWPNYPDGTPVSSAYSGGCIRLSNDDAKVVYDLAAKGMPVLVFEKDFANDNFTYTEKHPSITATHYLAADLKNNYVFLEQGTKDVVPMGSLTELMTALVSAEYINLDKEISYNGERVTAINVLYPLMLESSNDAATALASTVGENWFVKLMNQKVKSLGMNATELADVTGESAGNTTTAEDIFNLAKYILNNRSFVWKISTGKLTSSAYGSPVFTNLQNQNEIPGMPLELIGGKFDGTPGNESFIGVYNLQIQNETRPIAIMVFGSQNAKADVVSITNYIQANFK